MKVKYVSNFRNIRGTQIMGKTSIFLGLCILIIQVKIQASVLFKWKYKIYKLNSVHWKMIRNFSVNTISFGRWKTRVMGVWNQIIIWRRWIEWRTAMDWKHIRSKIVDCCDFSSFDVITYILWVDPDTFESLTESWPYI